MEKKKSKLKFKLTRRRVIVLIIAALLLLLLLVGIVNLFKLIFAKEKSVGNLANMGLVVEDGNTLFYNKYEDGIVKVKGNKEYQNKRDIKVYSFIDGIKYYGIKNPSEQPGLCIGICANKQVIKYAKTILSYITNKNCNYKFIENFKFSMKDNHLSL